MPLTTEAKTAMFEILKASLENCCPPMVIAKSSPAGIEIIGNKPVPYGYKKEIVPGMYFASAVLRKDVVSFYVFPLYAHAKEFEVIAPTAIKCLKGKTCFTFKKPEQVIKKEIDAILKKGMEVWDKEGYMQ
jgi:hypothetical protein